MITGIATFSVVSGVDKGLKWLSNINMVLRGGAAALRPTCWVRRCCLFQAWVGNLGGYVALLPEYMLRMAPL